MGRRGSTPTALNELLFWEAQWYQVFRQLRGLMPSAEIALGRRRYRGLLEEELQELQKQMKSEVPGYSGGLTEIPKDHKDVDALIFREGRIQEIKNELKRRPNLSEPAVWRALVAAGNGKEVLAACQKSKRWLNPEWPGRSFVRTLWENAGPFAKAKSYVYYPRRESGDQKRVAFFARAMAGIACDISPVTAIDKFRKMKHGPKCPCADCRAKVLAGFEFRFLKPLIQVSEKDWRKIP